MTKEITRKKDKPVMFQIPMYKIKKSITAFIAGDSIIKRLSANKMNDTNLRVKVKSNSGGRV